MVATATRRVRALRPRRPSRPSLSDVPTGVTDGALLEGVKFRGPVITTETIIYRSLNGTVRRIRGEHRQMSKFNLD